MSFLRQSRQPDDFAVLDTGVLLVESLLLGGNVELAHPIADMNYQTARRVERLDTFFLFTIARQLGEVLMRSGRGVEAVRALEEARTVAERAGETPLVYQAAELLELCRDDR